MLEELKPEAGASTGGGLSRAGFLKALAGGLAAVAVAAIGVEEASAGCPCNECTEWVYDPCNAGCPWDQKKGHRLCRRVDPCAGAIGRWFEHTRCCPCSVGCSS